MRLVYRKGMADSYEIIVSDGNLRLRAMRDHEDDYARVVAWRNQPHVRQWWDPDDPPMTMQMAMAECRPCLAGIEPDHLAFIEIEELPVGFVQYYPWAPYAGELAGMGLAVREGSWSLDIYVGEPDWVNCGIGSRTVRMLCDFLFLHEGASEVAFGVDRENARARRAYEKAGMTPTVEYLDTDTRDGERVWSVLMVRSPGDST